MDSNVFIKIDYKKDRPNPSQLFEAMSLYIAAYEQFGQILAKSIDIKQEFKFNLEEVQISSIKAKLSQAPGIINDLFINRVASAGARLFEQLIETDEVDTEDQIDQLAANLEEELIQDGLGNDIDSHIDRKALTHMLGTVSKANNLILKDETVEFGASNYSQIINTTWRLTGDVSTMFLGVKETVTVRDYLYVKIAINEGKQLWTFKSASMNKTFTARILVKDWIKNYQLGLIPPIGPKDTLLAEFNYDLYKPYDKRKMAEVRNVKITKIDEIVRGGSDEQIEIPA
ncbi:hypothetical protein [Acinetobacter sp. UBA5984]|uniref:hypothetical protein n=1 Tax=Acinetobacter sp. UBA5984 TaxID=1945948 RepID=UPI00257A18B1|nr:hypothetical protein [Acinetobacter sp. UBA5984]